MDGSLSTRLTEIYAELEAIEADKAPARAGVILSGLGFTSDGQQRATRWLRKHILHFWCYLPVSVARMFQFICLTQKMNDPKVFKLGVGNDLGIS